MSITQQFIGIKTPQISFKHDFKDVNPTKVLPFFFFECVRTPYFSGDLFVPCGQTCVFCCRLVSGIFQSVENDSFYYTSMIDNFVKHDRIASNTVNNPIDRYRKQDGTIDVISLNNDTKSRIGVAYYYYRPLPLGFDYVYNENNPSKYVFYKISPFVFQCDNNDSYFPRTLFSNVPPSEIHTHGCEERAECYYCTLTVYTKLLTMFEK